MSAPILTRIRWECLQALKQHPRIMDRAFMARELITTGRSGKRWPAAGATMESLRMAGWVQKVIIGPDESLGWRLGRAPTMWQITEAGRKAVENCPDTFPGDPVDMGEA